MEFGNQYKIGRKYRDRSLKEILEVMNNLLEMYDWVNRDRNLYKSKKGVHI
jgi:hypothetical protein